MFSLENKNKIGILSSLFLITTTFLQNAIGFLGQQITGVFYHSTWFNIYNIIYALSTLVSVIVLISFIKDFFKRPNITTLIIGVTFFIYAYMWSLYRVICNNFFSDRVDYIFSTVVNVLVIISTVVLLAVISIKLLNAGGFARLISLGGVAYILLYIANSIWNFMSIWSYSTIVSIISIFYFLVPPILLASYFLFVEN